MEQNIVKTALLGTANSKFDISVFPKDIVDVLKDIDFSYLDALSLYTSYIDGGKRLDKIANISKNVQKPPKEELPICSSEMKEFLEMIISQDSSLTKVFLRELFKVVRRKGVVLPAEYIVDNPYISDSDIELFGKRGEWVKGYDRGSCEEIDYLSLKKGDRNQLFEELMDRADEDAILEFFVELIDALSPSERLQYVMRLEHTPLYFPKVIEFLYRYVDGKKRFVKLSKVIYQLKLRDSNSPFFKERYDEYFSKIWVKKRVKYTLIEPKEFEQLCSSLEIYSDFDETIEFIFFITPVSYYLEMMDLDLGSFLDMLKRLKTYYNKEILFQSLLKQSILRRDRELFFALIDRKVPINSQFIYMFDGDELFDFIQKYMVNLNIYDFSSLKYMIKESKKFHKEWSREFSLKFIEFVFKNIHQYKSEWVEFISTISPYLDMSAMEWIENYLKKPKLANEFDDLVGSFATIYRVRKKFEEIKSI
jgi:hypothetical protein